MIYKTLAIKAVVVLALSPLDNATQIQSSLMVAKASGSDSGCIYFGSLGQCNTKKSLLMVAKAR